MARKLTPKQKRFIEEYLLDANATQSAIRAGYSKKTAEVTGCKLLINPRVAVALRELQDARSKVTKIDAEYVLRQSVKLHERCMQEVKPKMVKKGKEMVHAQDDEGNYLFVFDASGAAKGLELIGKHVSVQSFNEKKTVVLDLENATEEELEAELARLIKESGD